MRNRYLVLLITCLLVFLVGCGDSFKETVAEWRNSTAEFIQVDESEDEVEEDEDSLEEAEEESNEDTEEETEEETEAEEDEYDAITKPGTARIVASAFEGGDIEFVEFQAVSAEALLEPRRAEIMGLAQGYQTYEDLIDTTTVRKVAEIVKGKYAGYDLLTVIGMPEGPSFSVWIYRLAYNPEDGDLVYLEDGTDSYVPYFIEGLTSQKDSLSVIKGASMPETIFIADTNNSLSLVSLNHIESNNVGDLTLEFVDPAYGDVYTFGAETGCFLVETPDGLYSQYAYNPGFVDGTNAERTLRKNNGSTLQIGDNYKFYENGCGGGRTCYVVLDNVDESNLYKFGASLAGVEFFKVKEALEVDGGNPGVSDERRELAKFYEISKYKFEEAGISFEDYLKSDSVLFWQDPLDRWVGLFDVDFAPLAECGKPVVYLYPEQAEEVKVKVLLDELTVTIPEHGKDGWTVLAQPNGQLTNLVDGEEYPYLFWEGHKDTTINMSRGAMVNKAGLKFFLGSALKDLGLNSQEKADFMEFWYPIMKAEDKPYYFISFMGTEDFNKVAPLEISPVPDTLIRIFLYYEALDKPFATLPQDLSSVPRDGFTVVEWGGNLTNGN